MWATLLKLLTLQDRHRGTRRARDDSQKLRNETARKKPRTLSELKTRQAKQLQRLTRREVWYHAIAKRRDIQQPWHFRILDLLMPKLRVRDKTGIDVITS